MSEDSKTGVNLSMAAMLDEVCCDILPASTLVVGPVEAYGETKARWGDGEERAGNWTFIPLKSERGWFSIINIYLFLRPMQALTFNCLWRS